MTCLFCGDKKHGNVGKDSHTSVFYRVAINYNEFFSYIHQPLFPPLQQNMNFRFHREVKHDFFHVIVVKKMQSEVCHENIYFY